MNLPRRVWLGLLGVACGTLVPARAQVAVGYSSTINATGLRTQEERLNLRSRTSFGIGGSNVEPLDGGRVYDAATQWRIRDTSRPSSLILVQENSVFDARQETTTTSTQLVRRLEEVTVTLLAPLGEVLEPQSISPLAPVVPVLVNPLSTTVFP